VRPADLTMPIACTLDGPTMAERLRRIKALTETSLLSHELRGGQLRLAYRLDAADEVRAIVALERSCCAFLDFLVQEAGPSVELIVSAPPEARDSAAWLFAQFLPGNGRQAPQQACSCGNERVCG
jgi:hypothetical protein